MGQAEHISNQPGGRAHSTSKHLTQYMQISEPETIGISHSQFMHGYIHTLALRYGVGRTNSFAAIEQSHVQKGRKKERKEKNIHTQLDPNVELFIHHSKCHAIKAFCVSNTFATENP